MTTPYRSQQRHHFWKTATGTNAAGPKLDKLYQKKFDLGFDKGDAIATAGSCFAQNIRSELILRNCIYADVEPPPQILPKSRRQEFGFDMFSARYGNIYTAAQLRQLAERAFGLAPKLDDECWFHSGRYFDPFRPTIEPNGFASREEMEISRAQHLKYVKFLLRFVNNFVFTLGLTEGWMSSKSGAVYPMCPGTAAGEFDPDTHVFFNQDTADVIKDMQAFLEIVRQVNPQINVILTVSPVPLVATATNHHVANATSYSKAVLRAAAGALYNTDDKVDYFPSYEVFTSPMFLGQFYEDDRRTPSRAGIKHAMNMFFSEHGEGDPSIPHPRGDLAPVKEDEEAQKHLERQEELCDEIILEGELRGG